MNLTDFFIPSLISAIYTLCIGLSVYALSVSLGKIVFRNEAPWTKPLYFFSGLGAIGWIIWVASLLGLADVWFLRVITWLIIGSSAILIKKGKFSLPSLHLNRPSGYNFGSRAFFLLCAAVAMAAIIISLAAPTDADSLDYHLGVPLEILRNHGSIWFNQDHLHYRMAGFGEMLNLIGVVNGCPQLGSFLQVLGLILLIDLLALISGRPITTVFALCFGIPVIFALLFTQKHQYTGIISSTICFIAVSQFSAEIRGRMLVPFALSLFMAASIKHSFLLSSICVLTLWVLRLGFGGSLKSKLLVILLLGLVILAPQYGYRWQHFGDPLAPLLETLKSEPDFATVRFLQMLNQYEDSSLPFPMSIFIPDSLGTVSTVLGISALIILAVILHFQRSKHEVFVIILLICAVVALGQRTSRFFLEPYYWSLAIFLSSNRPGLFDKVLLLAAKVQFVVLTPLFLYSGIKATPAILSDSLREIFLRTNASFYEEALWVNATLPDNTPILTDIRSRSLLNTRTVPVEYVHLFKEKDSLSLAILDKMIKKYRVQYVVLSDNTAYCKIKERYAGDTVCGARTFSAGTRNPFNRVTHTTTIYRLRSY